MLFHGIKGFNIARRRMKDDPVSRRQGNDAYFVSSPTPVVSQALQDCRTVRFLYFSCYVFLAGHVATGFEFLYVLPFCRLRADHPSTDVKAGSDVTFNPLLSVS